MISAAFIPGTWPKLSSFWTALKQHLTGLTLETDPYTFDKGQLVGALAMLPALQRLQLERYKFEVLDKFGLRSGSYLDLLWEEFALKLPHLVSFRLEGFERGQLVLACPKLAVLELKGIKEVHLQVQAALLKSLKLDDCKRVHFAMNPVEEQLQDLENLCIKLCSQIDSQLIEGVGRLNSLRRLEYTCSPATCLPQSFPQSLCSVDMMICYWPCNLPKGFKELRGLEDFSFRTSDQSWRITVPLAELLPMNKLKNLQLGFRQYILDGWKLQGEGIDTKILGAMLCAKCRRWTCRKACDDALSHRWSTRQHTIASRGYSTTSMRDDLK